jgi:hypothetical protein
MLAVQHLERKMDEGAHRTRPGPAGSGCAGAGVYRLPATHRPVRSRLRPRAFLADCRAAKCERSALGGRLVPTTGLGR